MRLIYLLFVFTIGFGAYAQECDTNIYEALKYEGKKVTVCGVVSQIHTLENSKGKPTYINMGERFPNHSFTVVIWGSDFSKFEKVLEQYKDKQIAVTGVVKEYREKPQIILNDPKQIKIIE